MLAGRAAVTSQVVDTCERTQPEQPARLLRRSPASPTSAGLHTAVCLNGAAMTGRDARLTHASLDHATRTTHAITGDDAPSPTIVPASWRTSGAHPRISRLFRRWQGWDPVSNTISALESSQRSRSRTATSFRRPRRTIRSSGATCTEKKSQETPSASQASPTVSANLGTEPTLDRSRARSDTDDRACPGPVMSVLRSRAGFRRFPFQRARSWARAWRWTTCGNLGGSVYASGSSSQPVGTR
jgi:hypothetical protein